MNIWKVGSRWSEYGNPESSILDIFWKYNIIYVGNDKSSRIGEVEIGDLIAIADGHSIVGIGKALSKCQPVIDMDINFSKKDSDNIEPAEWMLGVKVKIYTIFEDEHERPWYKSRRRFCCIKNAKIRKEVTDLWEKLANNDADKMTSFKIEASTKTIDDIFLSQKNKKECVEQYVIPIYQRPYAWRTSDIDKFIRDIFDSYKKNEPMFIGTMQLSEKIIKDPKRKTYIQEIIDGQQRLSTTMLLLKILLEKYPENNDLQTMIGDSSWLETRVNNGEQQKLLEYAMLNPIADEPVESDKLNRYLKNKYTIKEKINEYIDYEPENGQKQYETNEFINHLKHRIIFVVIETRAGLSKTLQIFNTINTTGLDLNGGDIFKVRFFEYLKTIKGENDDIFEKVSGLYERIDKLNDENNELVTDIIGILNIYKQIIIAKYNLPNVLFHFGQETFFERLFDGVLGINEWTHFSKVKDYKDSILCLDELNKIIDIRFGLNNVLDSASNEINCSFIFLHTSRYGKYWLWYFIFLFQFNDAAKALMFFKQLTKVAIIYSVMHKRSVAKANGIMYDLAKKIFDQESTPEKIIADIDDHINSQLNHFESSLGKPIANNRIWKYLICRLSAMLDEDYTSTGDLISNKLFSGKAIDIEHIQSVNHEDESIREHIWEKWGDELHSIGNLMVLERHINQSISNKDYHKVKIPRYKKSIFETVKIQAKAYNKDWEKQNCLDRKKLEIDKIITYFKEGL